MEQVTIRVPATSANIGPGFDTLGIAFTLYNTVSVKRADTFGIFGCPAAYANEDNLAYVAFCAACREAGREVPTVAITITTEVPVSRGLGSSATLLVGGATAANILCDLGLSREDILRIVNRIEGHPDNVAAAIYGGMTAALQEDGDPIALPCALSPSLSFCALVPDCACETGASRRVLPTDVKRKDAVFNVTHTAVLLSALAAGNTAVIARALDDRLHQPYRKALIPNYDAVREAALAEGAHAFFISGSGSTCMAIYTDPTFPARIAPRLAGLCCSWRVLPLSVDFDGACPV